MRNPPSIHSDWTRAPWVLVALSFTLSMAVSSQADTKKAALDTKAQVQSSYSNANGKPDPFLMHITSSRMTATTSDDDTLVFKRQE